MSRNAGPEVSRRYRSGALAQVRRLVRRTVLAGAVRAGARVKVHGTENVADLQPPFVVVANHSSHLDTALIYSALPDRLAKNLSVGAATDHFFMKLRTMIPPVLFFNAYPIDRPGRPRNRNNRGMSQALLKAGVPLLIYPEGTRSRTGAMASFSPGAARLCVSRRIPCIPVALVGCADAFPAENKLPRFPRRQVHVAVGRPLVPRPGEGTAAFTRRIERAVVDLHDATADRFSMRSLAVLAARRTRRHQPR